MFYRLSSINGDLLPPSISLGAEFHPAPDERITAPWRDVFFSEGLFVGIGSPWRWLARAAVAAIRIAYVASRPIRRRAARRRTVAAWRGTPRLSTGRLDGPAIDP